MDASKKFFRSCNKMQTHLTMQYTGIFCWHSRTSAICNIYTGFDLRCESDICNINHHYKVYCTYKHPDCESLLLIIASVIISVNFLKLGRKGCNALKWVMVIWYMVDIYFTLDWKQHNWLWDLLETLCTSKTRWSNVTGWPCCEVHL